MPSSPPSLPPPRDTQVVAADDSVVDLIAELSSTDARFTQLALKQTEADQTEGPTQATVAASTQAARDDHEEAAAADSSPIAALQLTPKQDAAAEECCVQFVDQYEHVNFCCLWCLWTFTILSTVTVQDHLQLAPVHTCSLSHTCILGQRSRASACCLHRPLVKT
jgi:hypothetical protein